MRPRSIYFILGLALQLQLPAPASAAFQARSPFETTVDRNEESVHRIREHLARTEADLRRNTPAGLTEAQREARARRLDDLGDYRESGRFPINPAPLDTLHPIFIDAAGTACAVGRLIIASGRRDLAEAIAAAQNHAYLPEIADPRLPAWAEENGLTLEECARIQPSYEGSIWKGIRGLAIDSKQRPWVVGLDQFMSGGSAAAYLESGQWTLSVAGTHFQGLCLSPEDKPFLFSPHYSWWPTAPPGRVPTRSWACTWLNKEQVLLGVHDALLRWTFSADGYLALQDSLAQDLFRGDTVRWLQPAGPRLFAASQSTLAMRDTGTAAWDKVPGAPIDRAISGMSAYKDGDLWVGIGPAVPNPQSIVPRQPFATRGVRYRASDGTWTLYNQMMSSVRWMADTVDALLPQGDGAALIASGRSLYEFLPPITWNLLGTLEYRALSLAADGEGRIFVGTENGLFRLELTSFVDLGYPARSGSGLRPSRGRRVVSLTRMAEREDAAVSILGRRAQGPRAAGFRASFPSP